MVAKPTPFKRPSIEIGAVKRTWKKIPVGSVQIGDTVPDIGVIEDILGDPGEGSVVLRNVAHAVSVPYDVDDEILAFTK